MLNKQITKESSFFTKVSMGDCILADWAFDLNKELDVLWATLKISSFKKRKKQPSIGEVDISRPDSSQVYEFMWSAL